MFKVKSSVLNGLVCLLIFAGFFKKSDIPEAERLRPHAGAGIQLPAPDLLDVSAVRQLPGRTGHVRHLPGAPREVLTGDLMGQVYGVPVRMVTLDDGRTVCLSDLG